jgi:hypothetical protein
LSPASDADRKRWRIVPVRRACQIRGVFLRVPHRRDGQRACRGSFVDPDYRKRMTIEDILAAVRQIAS